MKEEMASQRLPPHPNYKNPLMEPTLRSLIKSHRQGGKADLRKLFARLDPDKVLTQSDQKPEA